MGVTAGWLQGDVPDGEGYSISGVSGAFHLAIAGSLTPGLLLGGLMDFTGIPEQQVSDEARVGVFTLFVGPFLDGYFDPAEGLHCGGGFGIGGPSVHYRTDLGTQDVYAADVGAAAWIGYDFWVGSQTALGFMVRGMVAGGSDDDYDSDPQATFESMGLLGDAVFH